MNKRILIALATLSIAVLACNLPGLSPTTQAPPLPSFTITPSTPLPPQQQSGTSQPPPELPSSTPQQPGTSEPPPGASSTPETPAETLTPTGTLTNTPAPPSPTPTTAVSAGPLGFVAPIQFASWQGLADGSVEARISIHIDGGAPPFTVEHAGDVFHTSQRDYTIVFTRNGCSAVVQEIAVESADGQRVSHDYYIEAPWCP